MFLPVQRRMGGLGGMYVDPVYSATGPLEPGELRGVVDEVNAALGGGGVQRVATMQALVIGVGLAMFVGGIVAMVTSFGSGPSGPPVLGILCPIAGVLVMGIGSVVCQCLWVKALQDAVAEARQALSRLNARYAASGVDFQLHEASTLVPYAHCHDGHVRAGVRQITNYTVVIQKLGAGAAHWVPPPGAAPYGPGPAGIAYGPEPAGAAPFAPGPAGAAYGLGPAGAAPYAHPGAAVYGATRNVPPAVAGPCFPGFAPGHPSPGQAIAVVQGAPVGGAGAAALPRPGA